MKSQRVRLAVSLLVFVSLATSVAAQRLREDVDEFGTQDGNDLWIPASQFTGENGATWIEGLGSGLFGYFYSSAASPASFHAHLPLPQGAYIDSWRAFFYDLSSTNNFTIGFVKWYDDTTGSPAVRRSTASPPRGLRG